MCQERSTVMNEVKGEATIGVRCLIPQHVSEADALSQVCMAARLLMHFNMQQQSTGQYHVSLHTSCKTTSANTAIHF